MARERRRWNPVAAAMIVAVLGAYGSIAWLGSGIEPIPEEPAATAGRPPPPLRLRSTDPGKRAEIAGYVIDSTDAPAAGATVEVLDADGAIVDTTSTDEDGAFRLASQPTVGDRLRISGDSLATSTVRWQLGDAVPRILVDRTIAVEVTVSERGAVAEDALVLLRDGSGAPALEERTDASGRARFADLAPGVYEVWAERGGSVSRLGTADGLQSSDTSVALALEAGTALEARLRNPEGMPLVGAVTATPIGFEHARRTFTTDERGVLRVPALPRGTWNLVASAPGHPARDFSISATSATESIEIRLPLGARISGTVVDDAGHPVAGAVLVLHAPTGSRAQEEAIAAPVGLRWVHPLAGKRHLPIRDTRRFGAARPGERPVECGGGHCGVDVGGLRGSVVHAAAHGTVVVTARAGAGKAGRYVAIEHEAGLKSFYMHLDDIRPDLDIGSSVRAGEAIGTLGASGIQRSEPHLHFALSRSEAGSPTFVDPEPLLHRAVVLPEASSLGPVDRAGVWIARPTASDEERVPTGAEAVVRSAADGTFTFEGVAAGSFVAVARKPMLVPGASRPVVARPGADVGGLEIRLSSGSAIVGRVVGPRGAIAGARIIATQGDGEGALEIARSYSDSTGYYRIDRVAGAVSLAVTATGFGDGEATLTAARTGGTLEHDFQLAALSDELAGVVRDASGFPVRGATVLVTDGPSAIGRRASSDLTGRFTIGAVAEGDYTLRVVAVGHPELRVPARSGQVAEIDLRAGITIDVSVIDGHTGAPLPGAVLRAVGPDGQKVKRIAGERGLATLQGIGEGVWRLSASPAGYAPARSRIDVSAADGRQSITLEVERGATLAGVVRDAYGERVPGARVAVGGASSLTDQDGRFRIEHAPTGSVTLRIEAGEARGEQDMDLDPGDEFVTLELRIE